VVNTSPAWAAPKLSDIIFGTVTARQAPSVVLRPVLDSGYCWAMSGASGWLEVRLPYEVRLQSFTLDHVPRAVATDPERSSAPRDVSVEALDADGNWVEVAKYEYNLDAPSHVQSFAVSSVRSDTRQGWFLRTRCLRLSLDSGLDRFIMGGNLQGGRAAAEAGTRNVRLRVYSNHGHPEYTCIYRFRVHGERKTA